MREGTTVGQIKHRRKMEAAARATFKEVKWRDGNHMIFTSGHEAFDRQCDLITRGNCLGNVQVSNFIRPYNEVECNGVKRPPGHLRNFDLSCFGHLPSNARKYIEENTVEVGGILYEFRFWRGNTKVTIGYIFTRTGDLGYEFVKAWPVATCKAWNVLHEAAKYISTERKNE